MLAEGIREVLFQTKHLTISATKEKLADGFDYLDANRIYFDSACQSLRPEPVLEEMRDYYTKFNSCGDRVKYRWGLKVDEKVEETRADILKLLKLSPKNYFVSFTLNTTYGLNLILNQLKSDGIKKVVTSDIEHNSVFLSTLAFADKHGIDREVLARNDDGSINLGEADFTDAVVVLNAVSNIDGRQLKNINNVAGQVHRQGGLFIVDAAQAMAYHHKLLAGVDADAICFSSHKMYGPSLGVVVAKKSLLERISTSFIGGGMVDDVKKDSYKLLSDSDEHIHTAFEAGLQPYAEIIGLGAAIKWLTKEEKSGHDRVAGYVKQLADFLQSADGFHVLAQPNSPTISFYHDEYDAHLLAEALSDQDIMVRSGYFCAHYYLHHIKDYPPLVRLSLGLHNRQSDIDQFIKAMEGIAK